MPEAIEVIHVIIDILAGLKAIDGNRQAELHAALEPQAPPAKGDGGGIIMPPDPA
jgi:hypothetical protein